MAEFSFGCTEGSFFQLNGQKHLRSVAEDLISNKQKRTVYSVQLLILNISERPIEVSSLYAQDVVLSNLNCLILELSVCSYNLILLGNIILYSVQLLILNLSKELIKVSSLRAGCRSKVNRQQPRSAGLRPIQKIPTPIKLLIFPLPEMINQICKKYSLENSQDKKTSDDTCDIFQK